MCMCMCAFCVYFYMSAFLMCLSTGAATLHGLEIVMCMPYVYALCVCLTGMPCVYALRVCPYMYALCVCRMCMPYVYALYVYVNR